jgi:Eukaryotic aspartyl protease
VLKNQAVECAKSLSSEFATGQGDGLLGLAFDLINTVKPTAEPTPVQTMNTEGVTPKVSTTVTVFNIGIGIIHLSAHSLHRSTRILHIRYNLNDKAEIGYIDTEELDGATPFYTPIVDKSGFWKISSVTAVVNGKTINRAGNTSICDTGTTLCLVDSNLCKAIYSGIKGAK